MGLPLVGPLGLLLLVVVAMRSLLGLALSFGLLLSHWAVVELSQIRKEFRAILSGQSSISTDLL